MFHDTFSERQKKNSSTERELLTLSLCLDVLSLQLAEKTVVYNTDSMCLHVIMDKGSTKPNLHRIAVECRRKAQEKNIKIHTAWISRNHNEKADALSKDLDTADWGISRWFFEKMEQLCCWKFSLDAFADNHNHKVKKFYSRWAVPGCAGVDGLRQDWSTEVVWMVPPLGLLPAALNHMDLCASRGMLVYPSMETHIVNPLVSQVASRGFVAGRWDFPGKGVFVEGTSRTAFGPEYHKNITVVKLDFRRR